MVTKNFSDAPVELADAMQAGFKDAMARIDALNLNPLDTLVDKIASEVWVNWDATNEVANVLSTSDSDEFDDDGELSPVAA